MIKGIVVDLRQVVDQIDKDFKKTKDLIIEIARRLDEGRFCERGHISRKIISNIRDTLMPKLLSGELRIKYAQNITAEAR